MFDPVPQNPEFASLEKDVLRFWREHQTFKKSMEQRATAEEYVFYDGPPFATGLPHYGHVLPGTIKDVVPRYQTMCGKHVRRTFGWDCHGLPVENEMEKELGFNNKHEIEAYGVAKFNEACRGIVLRYTKEWEEIVERMGRWVDFEHGYRTMDKDYMESIWWVFRQLWDKGLLYEGHKIVPYCPRCATPLSNFEANQGYEDVQDPSITVRFRSLHEPHAFFLVWTTTPWTLPSNLGLAVNPDVEYLRVLDGGEEYVLAAARLPAYYPDPQKQPQIRQRLTGKQLAGTTYLPLFPYFAALREKGAFRVVAADYVSTEDGTGIVHMAPGFGEDDAAVCRANGIPMVCPVDAECRFTADVPDYAGRFVKETDRDIMQRLKDEKSLVHRSTCQHSYPHCYRCDSPLIYRAIATWFVRVEQIKERMLAANAQTSWMPEHLRDGRFGNWLKNARDWAVSRNRFWGCPLPIWRSADGKQVHCVGSIAELEKLSGRTVTDIHKHFVDDIALPGEGGAVLRRVPEVLDCWFESGSMPYAQHHYPFENKAFVEQHFPADFIAEGLDQTRGWFYTLTVLGTALFDKPPFRHVVVNGLVLAEDGRKMSKRLKNYPDPKAVMDSCGADALRLCLLSSPVVRAEDLRFSEKAVKEMLRMVILPLWNAYSFLVTYARVNGWMPQTQTAAPPAHPENLLDRWIVSRLDETVEDVRGAMDAYDLQRAATRFTGFLGDLTNWYIRRSRRRFWKSQNDGDKQDAYATLHHVLITFAQIAAPFIPFVTEVIYRNLRTPQMPESVHLTDFPVAMPERRDAALNRRMAHTMTAVSLGRHLRTQTNLRVRQPLRCAVLVALDAEVRGDLEAMGSVIAEELNVKKVEVSADEEVLVSLSAKANFKALGPRLGKAMKDAAAAIARLDAKAIRQLTSGGDLGITLPSGQAVAITVADVQIQRQEKEGMTVANEGDITVALDTRLDEALIQEGMARDIVNRIQTMRKDAGLEVSDRIHVQYEVPPEVAAAVTQFTGYISSETLALSLMAGVLPEAEPADINGQVCRFALRKA